MMYVLGRSIARGERLFGEVVHFRAPGTYLLQALWIRVFGDRLSVAMLDLRVESHVLFPLCLYVFGRVLTRRPWLSAFAALACIPTPPIYGLRIGLNMLAIATFHLAASTRRRALFVATGMFLAGGLVFGQEIFLIATAVVGCALLTEPNGHLRSIASASAWIAAGFAAVAAPFLVFIAVWSSLPTYLYYEFVYAIVEQPRGMNLPVPSPFGAGLAFYAAPVVYAGYLFVLVWRQRLDRSRFLLISFGTLSLVSAYGRADAYHLLFALPTLYLVLPLAAAEVWDAGPRYASAAVRRALVLASAHLAFALAATRASVALAGTLGATSVARLRQRAPDVEPRVGRRAPIAAAACVAIAAALAPAAVRSGPWLTPREDRAALVSGMYASAPEADEVASVARAIREARADTIFSFPIRPFFYSLVPHHATRFVYLEPELTPAEQRSAISDLRRAQPKLVVFDPKQVGDNGGNFGDLVEYVTSRYRVRTWVGSDRMGDLWILGEPVAPRQESHLVFRMRELNGRDFERLHLYRTFDAAGVPAYNIFQVARSASRYRITPARAAELDIGIASPDGSERVCGRVEVSAGAVVLPLRVCSGARRPVIDLSGLPGGAATISLRTGASDVVWLDPVVRERA